MQQPKFAYYGGAELPKSRGMSPNNGMLSLCSSLGAQQVAWIGGVLVFFLMLMLYSYGLYFRMNVVVALTIGVVIVCVCLILNRHRHIYLFPLGASCAVAMACGVALGIGCYNSYSFSMFVYANSRTYYNVIPEENIAAIPDAGRIAFAREARLDTKSSVGYATEDGDKYCIAPIRDLANVHSINFWAVGINCCSLVGKFDCDAASDPHARSGIVVFDDINNVFGKSSTSYYEHAQRKAAAVFGLIHGDKPIFVKWVTSETLNDWTSYLKRMVWTFIVLATLLYACISFGFVWAMCKLLIQQSASITLDTI